MLFSLLLTASVFLHAKRAPNQPHSRSSTHRLSRQSVPLPRTAVVTAIQGDIQFVMIASPSPGTAPFAPDPVRRPISLKPSLVLDSRTREEREEQFLIDAINAERMQRGLEALVLDPLLTQTAREHSREMSDQAYFDHHSPTAGLTTPMDRYWKTLREWGGNQPESAIVGENIFYCSLTTDTYNMAYAHQCLMASRGHRANILEPRFTKVGVGLYRDSQGQFWVTEMFLRDE